MLTPGVPNLISVRHLQDGILPTTLVARHKAFSLAERILRKGYSRTVGRLRYAWQESLTPYHGSTWWALTPAAAEYVLRELENRPTLIAKYRKSFASDEQFVPTLIGNSAFASRSTGEMPFTGRGVWKTANLHVIDPSLARWFTINDLDELRGSDKFFVRKVSSARSAELLDALDGLNSADIVRSPDPT